MMRSLHARLVAVLLGLLLFLGAILITITFYSTRLYEEEVVQRLNRALASSLDNVAAHFLLQTSVAPGRASITRGKAPA